MTKLNEILRRTGSVTTYKVYEFTKEYITEKGFSPTFRDIGVSCNIAPSTASQHIDKLVALGYLMRDGKIARSIRIIKEV